MTPQVTQDKKLNFGLDTGYNLDHLVPQETLVKGDCLAISAGLFNRRAVIEVEEFIRVINRAGVNILIVAGDQSSHIEKIQGLLSDSVKLALTKSQNKYYPDPSIWFRDKVGVFSQDQDSQAVLHRRQYPTKGGLITYDLISECWTGKVCDLPGAYQGGQLVRVGKNQAIVCRVKENSDLGVPDLTWVNTAEFQKFIKNKAGLDLVYIDSPTVSKKIDFEGNRIGVSATLCQHSDLTVGYVDGKIFTLRIHPDCFNGSNQDEACQVDSVLSQNQIHIERSLGVKCETVLTTAPQLERSIYDSFGQPPHEVIIYRNSLRLFSPLNFISISNGNGIECIVPSYNKNSKLSANEIKIINECEEQLDSLLKRSSNVSRVTHIPCFDDATGFLRCATAPIPGWALEGFKLRSR